MLLVQPDPANLMQLLEADQRKLAEVFGTFAPDALLGFQHPPEPVFAGVLRVGPGDGPVVEELHVATHPPEVALVAVGLVELVAELEERGHPDLLLVILDHRLHRPVLVDDGADPAAKPAAAAAR